jgi:hypothetical protein
MSYDNSARNNKHPKVGFSTYLYSFNEPRDTYRNDLAEEDDGFKEDIYHMRRRFRKVAQKLLKES